MLNLASRVDLSRVPRVALAAASSSSSSSSKRAEHGAERRNDVAVAIELDA